MQTNINSEHDYYDLFARSVRNLTEHGPELRGQCPFHEELVASFTK
jgi:hypothetical protein